MYSGISAASLSLDSCRLTDTGDMAITFRSTDGVGHLYLELAPQDLDELFEQVELARQVAQRTAPAGSQSI